VKIDIRLHRDKMRLAQTKLASLAVDHPLREKYYLWIQELDELMAGSESSFYESDSRKHNAVVQAQPRGVDDCDEVHGEEIDRRGISLPVGPGVACNDKRPVHSRQADRLKCSAGVDERIKELMAENQWLRDMLGRYSNSVDDGRRQRAASPSGGQPANDASDGPVVALIDKPLSNKR